MPIIKRHKNKISGCLFYSRLGNGTGKPERIYYIIYRKDGRLIEEKAGRQFQDDMTAAKAAQMKTKRIQKDELSNKEQRIVTKKEKTIRK